MEKEAGWDKQLEEKDKKVVAGAYHSKKIAVFTGMVCVTILLSVVFNVWVVRFSLTILMVFCRTMQSAVN